jgi:hypothetical protein
VPKALPGTVKTADGGYEYCAAGNATNGKGGCQVGNFGEISLRFSYVPPEWRELHVFVTLTIGVTIPQFQELVHGPEVVLVLVSQSIENDSHFFLTF